MLVLLGGIDTDSTSFFLGMCLALLGVGMGLSFGPASTAAIESAPREMAGTAAGTNSMMRYVGSIIGAAVLGAVLTDDGGAPEVGLFRFIFLLLTVMAGVALAASLFIHRFAPGSSQEASEAASAVGASPAR
jgi:MFS family permease